MKIHFNKTGFRRLALCTALLAGWSAAVQAQSLVDLYEAARGFDANYLSAKLQFEANVARAEQNRAGMRTSANLSAGWNYTQQDLSPVTAATKALNRGYETQTLSATATHPIYRPANQAAYDQAEKQVQQARALLEVAEQELILRTSQAYFDVLAAQDGLTAVQAQRTSVAEQLAAAKRRFEVGTSTIVDTRQAQATFDRIQAAEIQAENDLAVRRLALDQLVGRTGTRPLALSTPVRLAPVAGDVSRWVQDAETLHPNVRGAQSALDIARLEVTKAQAGHLPTLDAVASQAVTRTPGGTANNATINRAASTVLGFNLNLPLFAGYATENRIRETLALDDKARSDLEGAKRTAAQATRAAFFNLASGYSRVQALQAAESSAQSLVDSTKLGYQVGVTINLDVLDAQSQLFQSRRDLAVARYDVLVGDLRLRQASGVLSPKDLQAINAMLAKP
ncbi:MAG: TolC family outer membrane protein [Betaproteobacteria bacterium]